MRVIAGAAKGRKLASPPSATRPLTAKAKEALFSSLGDVVRNASILDLYAGSGSIGLEAMSRGAERAVFVERDRKAFETLRRNIAAVGLGGEAVRRDVATFLTATLTATSNRFDVVFVDPPYAASAAEIDGVLALVGNLMVPGGIIVVHRRTGSPAPVLDFHGSMSERRYGDSQLYTILVEAER